MTKVTLKTRDGRFVRDGQIPPFQPLPEVLLWGSRTFVRVKDGPEYQEGMAFVLDAADAVLEQA